jgi:hypothetical protein
MAIAPLPDLTELDVARRRPATGLRLVTDPYDLGAFDEEFDEEFGAEFSGLAVVERSFRTGPDVALRRQRRASARIRRRRLLFGLIGLALAVLLVLPLPALGTVTLSGKPTPGGTSAGLQDGSVYVVQGGDTLGSIARQLKPSGDIAPLIAEMVAQTGSSHVVAGEHLILP